MPKGKRSVSDSTDGCAEIQRREARYRRRGVALFVCFAVLIAIATVYVVVRRSGSEPAKGCTSDAMIGPDGTIYGRSTEHDCHFIDDQGDDLGG
jgi:hypothetical protein